LINAGTSLVSLTWGFALPDIEIISLCNRVLVQVRVHLQLPTLLHQSRNQERQRENGIELSQSNAIV
jgi:hypothetical protein